MFAWFDNSYWLIVIWIWQVCHLGLDVGDLSLREHFIPNTVNQEETCGFCWLQTRRYMLRRKLTWNGPGERIGHWTCEGRWHPSEGSHCRWRSAKRRDCWRRWRDLVLQLSGIRPVMTHLRGGWGGVGVRHHGVFWTVLHCGAFFLFALYAAHGYAHLTRNQRTQITTVMM